MSVEKQKVLFVRRYLYPITRVVPVESSSTARQKD